jgi:hypothetical protein
MRGRRGVLTGFLLLVLLSGCGRLPNPFAEPASAPSAPPPRPTSTPRPPTATPTPRPSPTVPVTPSPTPGPTLTPAPAISQPARDNGWEVVVSEVRRFKELDGVNAEGTYWIVLFAARNTTGSPRRLDIADFSLVGGGRVFVASSEATDRATKVFRRRPLAEPLAPDATAEHAVAFDVPTHVTSLSLRVFTPMLITLQPPPPPLPPTIAPKPPVKP